jgi:hypothetical protein
VRLPEAANAPVTVDECAYRLSVYSNARLFDLLACLADRVDACCEQRLLRYVSGDAQQGAPGATLPEPLVVQVVDDNGDPVPNETVMFTVRGGGGSVAPAAVASDANGRAQTQWTLGPTAGLNTMAASIRAAPELPMFALAQVVAPPVVMNMSPDYAVRLTPDSEAFRAWVERPIVAITFDREMRRELLEDPDAVARWLRVHQLRSRDERPIVTPVRIRFVETTETFPNRRGFTAVYQLAVDRPQEPARYLVQMGPELGSITDTGTPPLTLDGEFAGTTLTDEVLTEIFNLTTEQAMRAAVMNGLTDTGARLPRSGDGSEGGHFHGWFEIARAT